MPSFLLTNTNHILNKIDELSILSRSILPAIIAVTETWLSSDITDDILSLAHSNFSYVIYRRDRPQHTGGGVLMYIRDDIKSTRLSHLESDIHEVLWVALRPKILPRPFSILIVCIIYCPPWYSVDMKSNLIDYLTHSRDKLASIYPNAALVFCGDFNTLNTNFMTCRFNLKEIFSPATRGNNVLDKIFLNCCKFYFPYVDILPPLGRSDHNCVYLKPYYRDDLPTVGWKSVLSRRVNDSNINTLGCKLVNVNWCPLYKSNDVQFQTDYFYSTVFSLLEEVMPLTEVRVKNNDKPWVTSYFRHNIAIRNKAFKRGDLHLYKKIEK